MLPPSSVQISQPTCSFKKSEEFLWAARCYSQKTELINIRFSFASHLCAKAQLGLLAE
jgi:hypothetical protein